MHTTPLLSSFSSPLPDSHFQTPADPPLSNLFHRTWGENHGNTQSDYSQRTVIEYVTNTLRIALGNQIKKWIIYKDMECRPDRAERVEEYTYNIPQTTLQVWSWHFPTVVIHFYNAHKCSPLYSHIEIRLMVKLHGNCVLLFLFKWYYLYFLCIPATVAKTVWYIFMEALKLDIKSVEPRCYYFCMKSLWAIQYKIQYKDTWLNK